MKIDNLSSSTGSSTFDDEENFCQKVVFVLHCISCDETICNRGMKALLLADTQTELFSTDLPPTFSRSVEQNQSCGTTKCKCRINDIACLKCGNVVGYHVVLPCRDCMSQHNNGHLWMFYRHCVRDNARITKEGREILTWCQLGREDKLSWTHQKNSCFTSSDDGAERGGCSVELKSGLFFARSKVEETVEVCDYSKDPQEGGLRCR